MYSPIPIGIDLETGPWEYRKEQHTLQNFKDTHNDGMGLVKRLAYPLPGSPADLLSKGQGFLVQEKGKISFQLNPKNEKSIIRSAEQITGANIKFVRSEKIADEDGKAIIKGKLGGAKPGFAHEKGPLITMLCLTQVCVDANGDALKNPIKYNGLYFTYPDFREDKAWDLGIVPVYKEKDGSQVFDKTGKPAMQHGKASLSANTYETLVEAFKINLAAVIADAKEQGQAVPFTILAPGAFFRALDVRQRAHATEEIKRAFNDALGQTSDYDKGWISEVLALGGKESWNHGKVNPHAPNPIFFCEGSDIPVHITKANIYDIATKFSAIGVRASLPMMGNPTAEIGCNAFTVGTHDAQDPDPRQRLIAPVDEDMACKGGNDLGLAFAPAAARLLDPKDKLQFLTPRDLRDIPEPAKAKGQQAAAAAAEPHRPPSPIIQPKDHRQPLLPAQAAAHVHG